MTPTFEERQELAGTVRDDPLLKLIDFTRDGYRTMIVRAVTPAAADGLIETAEEAGYEWSQGADATRLILEAPEGASEKVSMGGNRL